jgi:hypothetical protein
MRAAGLTGPEAAALPLPDQAAVCQAIGAAAALVPYADCEAMARWLAEAAGIATDPEETLALALPKGGLRPAGCRLPWGRHADRAVFSYSDGGSHFVAVAPVAELALQKGVNLAGEPCEKVTTERIASTMIREAPMELGPNAVLRRGALLRSAAMLGAARAVNAATLVYARDRKQFGRSLSQFQVIQSHLAEMAGELAATSAILETALAAEAAEAETASAKVRAGQAAQVIARLAHQIHGAIGFTEDFPLQLWTRRLWAWREEYGNEAVWSERLGAAMIALGPEAYWERIAR